MTIDAHVHITPDGKWFSTNHDASVESLISELDNASIDKAVLLPIEGFIGNDFIVEVCQKYPQRFIGFVSVNPLQGQEAIRKLERYIIQFGLRGLKLHPRLQRFQPLCYEVISLLEKVAELDIPVVFDTFPSSSHLLIKDTLPLVYDELARKVPEAKIILAHSGGYRLLDAMAVAKSNANIYLDISYSPLYYEGSSIVNDFEFVIRKVGAHRVTYGSDYPEIRIAVSYNQVSKILRNFSQEERRSIFGGTIARLLKLES